VGSRKFSFTDVKSASTPIETGKPLLKDPDGADLNAARLQVNDVEGNKVVVSEDVNRRDLHLDDVDGVECFPNEEIFAELARMAYEKPPPKLTFYKAGCSGGCIQTGGKIEAIDADEDITLVDMEKDEETMIKMKTEKAKLLDEQIAQKLHDEKVKKTVAMDKQEKDDLERAQKYQNLKRKLVSIAQAKKNMIIYLKNMAGYKMEHFKGMTYDKIISVSRIIDAYHSFEDMLKGFDREDLVALWSLVKEKFSSTVPNVDKEKALWVELKRLFKLHADDVLWKLQGYMHYPITWKLHTNCGVHHVSSTTRRHDMFMLIEKDYPLSNVVMTLMMSARLQVEEDNEMARDLVIKIFMKANKPKSKSLDTSSK
nr:hypothetical protein [Tanacetum cinerariifolium]